jgi:signal transduction histidine kinase
MAAHDASGKVRESTGGRTARGGDEARIGVPVPTRPAKGSTAEQLGRGPIPSSPLQGLSVTSDRNRLSRDVHDLVSSQLIKISFDLCRIASLVGGPALEMLYTSIRDIDDLNSRLRRLVFNRTEPYPDGVELEPTIRSVVEGAGRQLGAATQLNVDGELAGLPPVLQANINAVVNEAVQNVVAHSRASRLSVQLTVTDELAEVIVADDGTGLPDGPVLGIGLATMAARARELNGTFEITAGVPHGTVVVWRAPLAA